MELVRYRTLSGCKVALVKEGRKHLTVVTIEPHVRARTVARTERRYMTPIEAKHPGRTFRRAGRIHGISKAARRILRGVR